MRLRSMTARITLIALAIVAALALLAGCSPLGALNAFVSPEGYTVQTAAYGADPRQQVDVYRPAGTSAPAPVVVFFYGGSWRTGERAQYRFVGQRSRRAASSRWLPTTGCPRKYGTRSSCATAPSPGRCGRLPG